ncbi:MAG: diacylglycerol/lipid kinase family protein [Bacteroidia bacterium]
MGTNKRIRFILNRKAGTGLNNAITKAVVDNFSNHKFDTEILYTKYPKHAIELSRQAVSENYDVVVAVGGDGTVNEVAQSLKNSKTSLAIIPTGSGNGFARHFKIPMKMEKALDVIKNGNTVCIDSLLVNDKFCINIAGIGFDAYIAHLFANYGKRGFNTYIKLVLKKYFHFHDNNYSVEYDSNLINSPALLISVANATQYGNNARIAPNAIPDDGIIDLTILRRVPVWHFPTVFIKIFLGKLETSKYARMIRSNSFKINSDKHMFVHLDGEPVEPCSEIIAAICPKTNLLIVP